MHHKVLSSYVGKMIKDELFAKPAPPAAPDAAEPAAPAEEPDRQELHDEAGRPLGTAYRVPGVAVYVIFDGRGTPEAELRRCVSEPGSQILFQSDRGRITALVYLPDPDRPPGGAEAIRAEDV